jgi:hypothetical protein
MKRNILHKFELVVYPSTIWIAIDCSDDFLQEKFKEEFIPMDTRLAACVYTLSGDILIRFVSESCMTAQYIAHESVHAALYVFDYMGCKVDYNNQEPFAFLVDCIVNFCNEAKRT